LPQHQSKLSQTKNGFDLEMQRIDPSNARDQPELEAPQGRKLASDG
jgi:hypothetical protein